MNFHGFFCLNLLTSCPKGPCKSQTRESPIIQLFAGQTIQRWGVMIFILLTLCCLTQNSGLIKLLLKNNSEHPVSAMTLSSGLSSSAQSEAQQTAATPCELSEKSVRFCVDTTDPSPLLIALFLLPLIQRTSAVISFIPELFHQARPRRVHLRLCRFQE